MYLIKYNDLSFKLVCIDEKDTSKKVYRKIDSAIALALIDKGCKVFNYEPLNKQYLRKDNRSVIL